MICAKSTSPAECFVHGLAVRLETISRNLRPFGNTGAEIVHERQSGFAIAGTDDVADDQLALGVQGRERPRITGIVGGGLRIRQGALLGIDEAPYLIALDMPVALDTAHLLGVIGDRRIGGVAEQLRDGVRVMARMLMPSTSMWIICTRFAVGNLFMLPVSYHTSARLSRTCFYFSKSDTRPSAASIFRIVSILRAGYTKVSALAVQGSGGRQTRWARQGGAVVRH